MAESIFSNFVRREVGVQYHPERDVSYAPLFDDFFAQVAH